MTGPFHADENATPLTPAERNELRRAYIDAMHAADNHDLAPLIGIARS